MIFIGFRKLAIVATLVSLPYALPGVARSGPVTDIKITGNKGTPFVVGDSLAFEPVVAAGLPPWAGGTFTYRSSDPSSPAAFNAMGGVANVSLNPGNYEIKYTPNYVDTINGFVYQGTPVVKAFSFASPDSITPAPTSFNVNNALGATQNFVFDIKAAGKVAGFSGSAIAEQRRDLLDPNTGIVLDQGAWITADNALNGATITYPMNYFNNVPANWNAYNVGDKLARFRVEMRIKYTRGDGVVITTPTLMILNFVWVKSGINTWTVQPYIP